MLTTGYRLNDAICIWRGFYPVPIGANYPCAFCNDHRGIGTNGIFVFETKEEPKPR